MTKAEPHLADEADKNPNARASFWVVEGGGDALMARLERDRMRDFARASSDWFWEIDNASCVTMLSDRLVASLGRPVSPFLGRPFEEIGRFAPNLAGDVPMTEAIAKKLPFRDQMMSVADADGKRRVFHLNGVPVFAKNGGFTGYRGAGIEVTEVYAAREEAEGAKSRLGNVMSELNRARLELANVAHRADRSDYAKEQFLAVVNHELRTPLNAIIGFAQTMEMQLFGSLGERYLGYCRDILDASQHLLGLIDDILDVSDLSDSAGGIELDAVKLSDLVSEAHVLIEGRASQKNINSAGVKVDPSLRVRADRRRLKQILVNLLSNAVKFTPIGGQVGIETASDENAGKLAITVWDTGIGVPKESHEAIFGKFEQLGGDAYARVNEGTGLGLHISRQLARAMGGDITLESTPGQGSRFTISLSVAPG